MAQTIRGASACLVDDTGRVLMIAREKNPFGGRRESDPRGDTLAFPGGRIEDGENGIDAARRELHEETGFRALGDAFAKIVIEFERNDADVRIESFAFSKWSAPESPNSNAELEAKWMTFADALASRLAPGMERALREFQRAFEKK